MVDINEYFYGCLMWAKALSRLEDASERKFTVDEIQHFNNIVARLNKNSDFKQKIFESDAISTLNKIRQQLEMFESAYYSDEDSLMDKNNKRKNLALEQDILSHFCFCICNKLFFPAKNSMHSIDKFSSASEFLIMKYTADTLIGFIPYTTNKIPWRTEYSVGELFKNAYQVSINYGKTTFFGRDKAAPFYDQCMIELRHLINEMKFEGLILKSMSVENICKAIIIRCGVAELSIKAESNDQMLIEICDGAMSFIITFFNNKDISHKIINNFNNK